LEASALEQNLVIIGASIPTVAPMHKHLRRQYTSAFSSTTSSRPLSGESDEVRHALSKALGMSIPLVGNQVVIVGGPQAAKDSQELPLTALPRLHHHAIQATTKTDVRVEYVGGKDVVNMKR